MWKKVAAMVASWVVVLAVFIGQSSALPTSVWTWYQPKVPKSLRK